jgi:uncharacterized repeat protein (TIGR01451 family)
MKTQHIKKNTWQILICVLGGIFLWGGQGAIAAEVQLPATEDYFFETNGPESPLDNGDWWTNSDYGAIWGNGWHKFQIVVPPAALSNPDFVVEIEIFDPECNQTGTEMDEMDKNKIGGNGRWDDAYFRLYDPHGVEIANQTYTPDGGTSESWASFTSFTIGDISGAYELQSLTEEDDENGYRLRILNDDPDGIPESGDEVRLMAKEAALQTPIDGSTIDLWFYVEPDLPTLFVHNFDMDSDASIYDYTIIDPDGMSTDGTISGEAVWETGSAAFPATGPDQFDTPVPGWWHASITLNDYNQFIFYGRPYTDNPPDLPQLSIDKDDGVDEVERGTAYQYSIQVRNLGRGLASQVIVTDILPAGYTFLSASDGGTYDSATRTVTWFIGGVEPGESKEVTVDYRVNSDVISPQINVARVEYQDEYGTPQPPEEDEDENSVPAPISFIGNLIWVDENKNGLQDEGETGLEGVTVTLLDATDTEIASTVSDANGLYSFVDIEAGEYSLSFELPEDYFFTGDNQGTDDTIDSDPDPETGRTAVFTLNENDTQSQWDAGVIAKRVSDLTATKQVERDVVRIGESFTFTLHITNEGPDPAENVQVIDNFPPGLIFEGSDPEATSGPDPYVWTIPLMNPGDNITITIHAKATDVTGGMDNNVFVSSENRDPVLENNSAAAQVHVLVPIELSSFDATEQNGQVHLTWQTQTETENMGFHVYRSETETGEYKRITSELIPGAGDSQSMHQYSYTDEDPLIAGAVYYYKLADVDFAGHMTLNGPVQVTVSTPSAYTLEQNYPNPFNMETRIKFQLKEAGDVLLAVYNTTGQKVRTLMEGHMEPGSHVVSWNGRDNNGKVVPTGTYLYTLRVNSFKKMQKMILLK